MARTHSNDVLDNIFILYDFQQVRDAIMIVAYFDNLKRWEKIFIYYSDDRWEIEPLRDIFSDTKYQWLCEQVGLILQHREHSTQFEGIFIDKNFPFDVKRLFELNKAN